MMSLRRFDRVKYQRYNGTCPDMMSRRRFDRVQCQRYSGTRPDMMSRHRFDRVKCQSYMYPSDLIVVRKLYKSDIYKTAALWGALL